jgi:uncharacterized SAM-binding protein YcdF (DUF218 family)
VAYYLGKFLGAALHATFFIFILLIGALYFLSQHKFQAAKKVILSVLLFLWFFNLPIVNKWMLSKIENQFPLRKISSLPLADAIVVLGGTVSNSLPPRAEPEEAFGGRLAATARIYHQHKAPLVIVSGGNPYLAPQNTKRSESTDMKEFLVSLLVPEGNIIEENRSRNTQENFIYTLSVLEQRKIKQIILVTSASHMPRAMAWFNRARLQITPFPTDLHFTDPWDIEDLIPSWGSMENLSRFTKEILGVWFVNHFQTPGFLAPH